MAQKKKKAKITKKASDGVPNKVAQQEAEAEELQRRLAAGEPLEGEKVKDVTENPDGTFSVDPDATPAAEEPIPAPAAAAASEPAPAKEFPRVDPGSVDVTPAAPAAGDDDLAKLQSRFDVLEGKYNTEIARLSTALQTSQNIIEQQEALIKNIQAGGGAANEPAAEATTFKKLNPDDYSSYGSEMEQMAATVNNLIAENQRLVTQIKTGGSAPGTQGENERIAKVEQTVKNLSGTVQMSAKQSYYAALDSAIVDSNNRPDWERINHDPKFAEWLAQDEPLTGIPRKAILLKANKDQNAERVISIFSEFKRSLQGGQMPNTSNSESGLASQAQPGTAAAAGDEIDNAQNTQGLVTTEMFLKAKNDYVQGRITETQFDEISGNYQRSIAKGQIQP